MDYVVNISPVFSLLFFLFQDLIQNTIVHLEIFRFGGFFTGLFSHIWENAHPDFDYYSEGYTF